MSKKITKNEVEKITKKLNKNIKKISIKNEEFKQNLEKLDQNQKENNLKQNEILPKFLLLTDKLKELNIELEEIENQLCKYKKKQKIILLTLNNKKIYQYLKDLSKFKENNQYFYLLFEFLGYNQKKTFDEVFIFFNDNFFNFKSKLSLEKGLLGNNDNFFIFLNKGETDKESGLNLETFLFLTSLPKTLSFLWVCFTMLIKECFPSSKLSKSML